MRLPLALSFACLLSHSGDATGSWAEHRTEESVRAAEKERLQALVDGDIKVAERRHAPDFQVINPFGRVSTKTDYLAKVSSGENDYLSWVPGTIAVRLHGTTAAIRYRSSVDIAVRGRRLPLMNCWNTGLYEYRDGRWQIVWFQVTQVRSPTQ
jgi:hypothetical protein